MPVSVELRLLKYKTIGVVGDQYNHELELYIRTSGRELIVKTTIGDLLYQGVTKFFPELKGGSKPTKKRLRRASQKQEREIERVGGRAQSGSGSKVGNKGDGRVRGRYRIENKFTQASSFRVTLAELRKIRSECEGLEVPVFDVQFKEKVTLRTKDNWVLVPRDHWEKLANAQAGDD